jgi:N-glycosidase YbiA
VSVGVLYPTAEHAFHAQKFTDGSVISEIVRATSRVKAFQLAGEYKKNRRADWGEIKLRVMEEIIRAKISQHEEVLGALLNTGDQEIVEDSLSDFWGSGCDGFGQNQFGKLLMKIRRELKSSQ